jgi:hypothetical protein
LTATFRKGYGYHLLDISWKQIEEVAVDAGTIATALLAIGAFALFMVLVRGMRNAESDVAAVVAGILGTRVEIERPAAAIEEPIRWRIDLLTPAAATESKAADRSKRHDVAKPLAAGTRS